METVESKIREGITSIKSTYYSLSILSDLVRIFESVETKEEFKALYIAHLIPEEWFTRADIYAGFVFHQYGENMALSEIKSIRGWISEDDRIHREECNKIDASFIVSKLVESINEGIEPSILFVPISYFVPVSIITSGFNS